MNSVYSSLTRQRAFSLQFVCTLLLLGSAFCLLPSAFGQGSLTPPGAPGPTMRTLDQVEPRTPIATNTTPGDAGSIFIITNSGSYYLTANITGATSQNGIRIAASDVTLDLNGFAMIGVSNSFNGILVSIAANNIRVRNGTVRDWGNEGVNADRVQNGAFEDLRLFNNGTTGFGGGLDGGTNSLARSCQSWANSSDGIAMEKNCIVVDSVCCSNGSRGIFIGSAGIVRNCTSSFNRSDGIQAKDNCLVSDNNASGNKNGGTAAGIRLIFSGGTRVENNNVSANDYGINMNNDGNLVVRNSAHSNTTANYNITGTETIGPIISTTGVITNNNPWANFSY